MIGTLRPYIQTSAQVLSSTGDPAPNDDGRLQERTDRQNPGQVYIHTGTGRLELYESPAGTLRVGVTIRFMDENIDTETDSQWMEFLNFYSALSAIGHEEIRAAETSDIVPALQ